MLRRKAYVFLRPLPQEVNKGARVKLRWAPIDELDLNLAAMLPLIGFKHPNAFSEVKSGELQMLSSPDSWGSDCLTYIAGLYYIESDVGYDPVDLYPGPVDLATLPAIGPTLGAGLDRILAPIYAQLPPGLDPVTVRIRGILHTESSAAFFQTTGKVTDWLSVTAGGRYQTETRTLAESTVGTPAAPKLLPFPRQSEDTRNFSPKISLDLRPLAMWLLGFIVFARWVPPLSPALGAAEISQEYLSRSTDIRIAMALMGIGSIFYLPFTIVITDFIKKIEGSSTILSTTQVVGGVVGQITFFIPSFIWAAAAFRDGRDPQVILAMSDIAWITFMTAWPPFFLQFVAQGADLSPVGRLSAGVDQPGVLSRDAGAVLQDRAVQGRLPGMDSSSGGFRWPCFWPGC